MVQPGCCWRRALSLSLRLLSLRLCVASVYPQTSPLITRLGMNPAVSSCLRLSLPPSLCLLACLFTSAPLLYSCDRRKERGGGGCWKERKRKSACERERGEVWDRCSQCKNLLCLHDLWKCSIQAKSCCSRIDSQKQAPPLATLSDHSGNKSGPHAHGRVRGRVVITEGQSGAVHHTDVLGSQTHQCPKWWIRPVREPVGAVGRDTWRTPNRLNTH